MRNSKRKKQKSFKYITVPDLKEKRFWVIFNKNFQIFLSNFRKMSFNFLLFKKQNKPTQLGKDCPKLTYKKRREKHSKKNPKFSTNLGTPVSEGEIINFIFFLELIISPTCQSVSLKSRLRQPGRQGQQLLRSRLRMKTTILTPAEP